jgi:hypothetical protein
MKSLLLFAFLFLTLTLFAQSEASDDLQLDEKKTFVLYRNNSRLKKKVNDDKIMNFDIFGEKVGEDCKKYVTYTGRIVDMNESQATIEYFALEEKLICPEYEEDKIRQATFVDFKQRVTVNLSEVGSIWYEPKPKIFFLTVARGLLFTGLIVAPLTSLNLKTDEFDTEKYYELVLWSAGGGALNLGLYFLFNERNLSFFPKPDKEKK